MEQVELNLELKLIRGWIEELEHPRDWVGLGLVGEPEPWLELVELLKESSGPLESELMAG